jgi:hypothetical protein
MLKIRGTWVGRMPESKRRVPYIQYRVSSYTRGSSYETKMPVVFWSGSPYVYGVLYPFLMGIEVPDNVA